jgi:hypothetical protein
MAAPRSFRGAGDRNTAPPKDEDTPSQGKRLGVFALVQRRESLPEECVPWPAGTASWGLAITWGGGPAACSGRPTRHATPQRWAAGAAAATLSAMG